MIMAAARKLAALSPAAQDPNAPLLPEISRSREISRAIALTVINQAIAEGMTAINPDADIDGMIGEYMWEPVYHPYERVESPC